MRVCTNNVQRRLSSVGIRTVLRVDPPKVESKGSVDGMSEVLDRKND